MQKNKKRKGFTLIELVIVIVILGILAGVAALSFTDVTQSSKDGVAKANLRAMKSAVTVYQSSHKGALPAAAGGSQGGGANSATYVGMANLTDLLEDDAYTNPVGYTYTYTYTAATATTPESASLSVTGGGLPATATEDAGTLYNF